ncbi:ester cyclase [Myxococcus sp. MISCRS1]|uniref:ester cyclase n=1 Tax=Myxococcus sp. MISCRS1 TaxID=2996786 RepID=UPI00226E26D0|nr:ester cyclase [Myxococcus sp. MISCRS1]MCY0997606.1 ester cyclase [Myxococcus sp. MISCRS1]
MTLSTKDAARRLYRRLEEAIHSGDFDVVDDVIQQDAVDHHPDPDMMPGREGIKQGFAGLRAAFPDIRFELEDLVAEGDKVACRITARATHRGPFMGFAATGLPVSYTLLDLLRFSPEGRLVERWGLVEEGHLRQQLGRPPR